MELRTLVLLPVLALEGCTLTAAELSTTKAEPLTKGGDSAPESSEDAAAEMARKLQNPLANIKSVMTDNAVGFNTGTDNGTSYGFQIQPVYAIDMPDNGFTLIPRAVIPIVGLEPGTKTRITGENVSLRTRMFHSNIRLETDTWHVPG